MIPICGPGDLISEGERVMAKNLKVPIGVLIVLLGLLWMFQGLGVIGGSVMSGKTLWAIIGPVVALAGLGLVVTGIRDRRSP
jgi:hypothetical protein